MKVVNKGKFISRIIELLIIVGTIIITPKAINSPILKENLYKFTLFAFYHKSKFGAIERRKFWESQYNETEIKIKQ